MRVSKSFSRFIDLQQLECHPANVYLAGFLLNNVSSECPGRYVLAQGTQPVIVLYQEKLSASVAGVHFIC